MSNLLRAPDRPLRVMFVVGSLARAGSERQMVNLAVDLKRRGHQVCIALTTGPGPLEEEAEVGGVELMRLYSPGWFKPLALGRLVRAVRQWNPDVVHPYLPRDNALVTVIKPLLAGARLVWGVRASDVDLTKYRRSTRLLWPFVVRASRFADLIIANSFAGASYHVAAGYPEHKMVVISNGIDTEKFRPDPELGRRFREDCGIPADAPVVGMLGRFDPMKGHDQFPEIFARVHEQVPGAMALVVGLHTDEQGRRFRQRLREFGIEDRVVLRQQTSEPEAMLNAIDVLALPSMSEGFPNVVAEAMACGKPVVAYQVGDVISICGEHGSVVSRGDFDSFALAARRVLVNQRADESPLRFRIVEKFSTTTVCTTTEQKLIELMNANDPYSGIGFA